MRWMLIAVLALVGGCAATGPAEYGPAQGKSFGYSEQRIEANRYRITYRGSGGMPPELVEDYALRRAAELSIDGGFEWFQVIARDLQSDERGGVSVGAGFGSGSYGRRGGVSVGVGSDLGTIGAQLYHTVFLEVLMGQGQKPASDGARTYDAREVLNSLSGPHPYRYEEE